MMEVKKSDNYVEVFLDEQRFIFDPPHFRLEPPLILTDPSLKVNKDKIFNAPGEFNVGKVYFFGFDDKETISYLFQSSEGSLFYFNGKVSEETLKKIKSMKIEIDALFIGKNFQEKVIVDLKPKIILSFQEIKLPKFTQEKGNKFKINLKKVSPSIFILQ